MEQKRLTFVATPDIEVLMDEAKRFFYDKTQSEMIRTLIVAGLNAIEQERNHVFVDKTVDHGVISK